LRLFINNNNKRGIWYGYEIDSNIHLFRVPLRLLERRSDWAKKSSRTDQCQTGSGTKLTTKSGTTLREDTGEEQSSASERTSHTFSQPLGPVVHV